MKSAMKAIVLSALMVARALAITSKSTPVND